VGVVVEWEAAIRIAEDHWARRPELCKSGTCEECLHDGCFKDYCDRYNALLTQVAIRHKAIVDLARRQEAT